MQSRGMGNFNICSADECHGQQGGAAYLTHSVLLPVIPTCSSPYTQAQQLIHDAGSLPGQRIVYITQSDRQNGQEFLLGKEQKEHCRNYAETSLKLSG